MGLGDPSSTPKFFMILILTAAILTGFFIKKSLFLPKKDLIVLFVIFIISNLVPGFYSGNLSTSLIGIYPFYSSSVLAFSCYMVIFFYMINIDHRWIKKLLSLVIFSMVFVSLYGILQFLDLDLLSWKGNSHPRVWSTLGNPNFLAGYLVLTIPVAICFFLESGKLFYLISVLLGSITLLLTSSRGGFIAFVLSLIFLGFSLYKNNTVKMNLRKICLFMLIVFLFFGIFNFRSFLSVLKRYRSIFDLKEANIASRMIQWDAAKSMIIRKPVFGWGTNGYYINFRKFINKNFFEYTSDLSTPGYPHNYFLHILVSGGLVFTGLNIWFWISIIGKLRTGLKKDNIVRYILLSSMIAYFVHSMFSFNVMVINMLFWVIIGAGMNHVINKDVKKIELKKNRYFLSVPVLLLLIFSCRHLYADYLFNKGDYKNAYRLSGYINKFGLVYGKSLLLDGKSDEAEDIFKERIKKAPYNALGYNALGTLKLKDGESEKALKLFEEALRKDPYLVDSNIKLAGIYREKGDLKSARNYYENALDLRKDLAPARYNLGVIYFKEGKIKTAIEEWKILLKYHPAHKNALNSISVAERETNLK